MGEDGLDQPLAQVLAPVLLKDEHIRQVGEGGSVRDHPRKSHLLRAPVHPEHQRVLHGPPHHVEGHAAGPVRPLQVAVDDVEIEAGSIVADDVLAAGPLLDHPSSPTTFTEIERASGSPRE